MARTDVEITCRVGEWRMGASDVNDEGDFVFTFINFCGCRLELSGAGKLLKGKWCGAHKMAEIEERIRLLDFAKEYMKTCEKDRERIEDERSRDESKQDRV